MSYKSVLCVVSDRENGDQALRHAVAVAKEQDGHLSVLCLGVDHAHVGYYYAGASAVVQQEAVTQARNDAEALGEHVSSMLEGDALRWSVETEVAQWPDIGFRVGLRARFSDLAVQCKPYGEAVPPEYEAIVEAEMFQGHCPVLVVPGNGERPVSPRRIGVAWNESDESLAAMRRALPLLQAAEQVTLVVIDPPRHSAERSDPGGAVSQLLSRHGVHTDVAVLARTMPSVADVLCRHAADAELDLLVMGAYGHSRFREAILGGATRDMLAQSQVPVFMAHR